MLNANRELSDARFASKKVILPPIVDIAVNAEEALKRKAAAEKRTKIIVGAVGFAGIVVGAVAAFAVFRE